MPKTTEKVSKLRKILSGMGKLVDFDEFSTLFRFHDGKTRQKKAFAFVKVAETEAERAVGLSKTASLGPNSGMFFSEAGSFWMPPGMKFALDICFLGKNGEILEKQAMPMDNGRGRYRSFEPGVKYALELPYGFCRRHRLNKGDFVKVSTAKAKS